MRVALFKDSRESFIRALDEASIGYEELRAPPNQVLASGTMITVAHTTAVLAPFAAVLVGWLKARASRKVILTLRDKRIVQLEGYSVEQVEALLALVDYASAIDTKPASDGAI